MVENCIPLIYVKLLNITPNNKKGSSYRASNYSPISINCILGHGENNSESASEYFAERNISTPAQFGVRHGHSTILQLINCHLDWIFNQNDGFAADAVFLDLKSFW